MECRRHGRKNRGSLMMELRAAMVDNPEVKFYDHVRKYAFLNDMDIQQQRGYF